jgi:predicted ATPase
VLDASAGANRTPIISGEAGAGKSSLLAAIADRAAERGFLAGHGSAAPVEGAWPYARSAHGQRVCIVLAHRPVPVANALEATRRTFPAPPGPGRDS